MRALLALAVLLLAGCTAPPPLDGASVVVVVAQDAVTGTADDEGAFSGNFGGHCAPVVLDEAARHAAFRFELENATSPALLVRKFDWRFNGSAQLLTVSADRTGAEPFGENDTAVASPLRGGPVLFQIALRGDDVVVDNRGLGEVVRTGGTLTRMFDYTSKDGNVAVTAHEELVLRNLGRFAATRERGLLCM